MIKLNILIERKISFVLYIVFLLIAAKSQGNIIFNDGQYHIINYYETIPVGIDVLSESNPSTYLEIVAGGRISQVTVSNTGRVILTGGLLTSNFQAEDNSIVTFLSGTLDDEYQGSNNSYFYMSGGTISERILLNNSATAMISGGTLGGDIDIRDFSTLTFVGSDFAIDGVSVGLYEDIKNYATYEFIDDSTYGYTGTITGTLSDGSQLNNYFEIWDDDGGESLANMYLVPEPCGVLLFGVGGMVVMGFRRRKNVGG